MRKNNLGVITALTGTPALSSCHPLPCRSWESECTCTPPLEPGEVHVWHASLSLPAGEMPRYASLLSPDERQRAQSFHFTRDRNRFIVARGVLREILAAYLAVDPRKIGFRYAPHGKPCLDLPTALCFNLSHTGEMALYAISDGCEVGADIESVHPEMDCLEIARHWFTREETTRLQALPETDRPAAFARCWVRKEAIMKGLGSGVSGLIETNTDAPPQGWTLYDLDVPPAYAAALAIKE